MSKVNKLHAINWHLLLISRRIPVEVLHTILLGACKYILKHVMPKLSKQQKREILASIRSFSTSGLISTTMYGNVCYYYNSFVGRDFKGWSQMALFVLHPYLNEGERTVLLSYSKVMSIFEIVWLPVSRVLIYSSGVSDGLLQFLLWALL